MGQYVELTASDGHRLKAWRCEPQGKARGAMIVIQEIFGVNSHIRDMTERFAAQGYLSIAPALFDRIERDYETGYSPDERQRGHGVAKQVDDNKAVLDMDAARLNVQSAGATGIVGYCMGGLMSYLAACRLNGLDAAVSYYGHIEKYKNEKPKCPVIAHIGLKDHSILAEHVAEFREARPEVPVFMYDAGHGFACDQRDAFHKPSTDEAWVRTLDFFAKQMPPS